MNAILAVDLNDKVMRDKLQRTTQLDEGFWTKFISLIQARNGKYYAYLLILVIKSKV